MSNIPFAQVRFEMSPKTIIITKIYEHDPRGLSTKAVKISISPSVDDSKEAHTISTSLLSTALDIDEKFLEVRASNEDWFIQIDWRFQNVYPKFTTRHRIVPEPSLSICFAAGTAWAENIASNPAFQIPHQRMPVPDFLRRPTWDMVHGSQQAVPSMGKSGPTTKSGFTSWDSFMGFPHTPRSMSPNPEDDHLSICSDLTSVGSTVSDIATPRFFSPPPSRQNSSTVSSINGDWMDQQVQQQLQDEIFLRQRREAEGLFARTGDLSGLIVVMEAANRLSPCSSYSGRARP